MAGTRRVFIHWDAEIDGPLQRGVEHLLGALQVDFANASQVDHDPDSPAPVRLGACRPMA